MTVIFDGKAFALEKETELRKEVAKIKSKKKITPKLTSILVGENEGSKLYLSLKGRVAERVGAEVEVISLSKSLSIKEIIKEIDKLNKNESVNGIMLQLPLPENFSKEDREAIINSIGKEKDVDGMREDSIFITPVVKAVVEVIRQASIYLPKDREAKVVVIGATGFEGKKIVRVLQEMGYKVEGANSKTENLGLKTKNADILISATGKEGLITSDMVKEGGVLVDVGSPKGDIRTEEIMDKASFISPVPGGVGPVTISYLLENLIEAAKN